MPQNSTASHIQSQRQTHGPTRDTGSRLGDIQPPDRLLRLREVKRRVGLSKTTIYSLINAGTFPDRVRLTERTVAWHQHEIEAFVASRQRITDRPGGTD